MNKFKILKRLIKEFRKIIRILWYDIWGVFFITIKQYGLAEKVFKRGLDFSKRRYPEFVDSFTTWIIFTYDYRGEKDKALKLLKTRIESKPEEAKYFLDLADFYLFNNEKDLAIENYKKTLELEKDEEQRYVIQAELNKINEGGRDGL